jgi:large subunit ribosomal protein L4
MATANCFEKDGTRAGTVDLPKSLFDVEVNEFAVHEAVVAYLANQRQGTVNTKERSDVSGGGKKPWRQKGTGRARAGTIRSPLWRGGGTVFGPHPRDYRLGIPKKLRQLARKSALNARAREGALLVVDALAYEKPKTKAFAELLAKLGVAEQKVLVLTADSPAAHNVYLSGRNIPGVRVARFADATAYDVLWSDAVVVEAPALTGAEPEASDA